MSTAHESSSTDGRRLSPADVHNVRFSRGSMLRPGYAEVEVDRFLSRVADELARTTAEKAELRDHVRALRDEIEGAEPQVAPSDQAVRILASAQQTADNYVAEAEEFSRQMTAEARAQYEEQLRDARESAGAIIQAAHGAAAKMTGGSGSMDVDPERASVEQLQEQVAYLKAFGQACRVQLRSYLEALLTDVESEWGRADPGALPQPPFRTPAQRSDSGAEARATFASNTAAEADDGADDDSSLPATAGSKSAR
jgi:DivIVA domain-containing protein